MYVEPTDRSACSPDRQVSLRLVEDPTGYNITLTGDSSDATVETKTFHFSECVALDALVLVENKLTCL